MKEILDYNSKETKLWYQKIAKTIVLEAILLLIGTYYFCNLVLLSDLPQVPEYLLYIWIIAIMLFYASTPFFKPYITLDSKYRIILGVWNLANIFTFPLVLTLNLNMRESLQIPALSILCYLGLQAIIESKYSTPKTPLPIFLFFLSLLIVGIAICGSFFFRSQLSENHFILLFLIIMILQSTSLISMIAYLLLEPEEHSAYWYYVPRQVAILSNLLLLYYFSF
jgi:hypothetical protein